MEINLNLLPQHKKDEAVRARYFRMALGREAAFSFILLTLLTFLGGIYFVLNFNYDFLSRLQTAELEKEQYKYMDKYKNEFEKINSRMALASSIKKDQLYWSELFFRLNALTGPGISLSGVANKDYAIFLVGKASDRDTLLDLKSKLEGEACFENIKLPLSDLVAKENIDFQIDLNIKSECLKK